MSDLPSSSLDYGAVVAEYFLALRGAGLMLSPLDEEVVGEWERRGLPVAVVCRGLRRGLELLREDGARRSPRSVRALRFAVEEEWRAYRSARVGDSPAPPGETDVAALRLEAARRLLAEWEASAPGALRDVYPAARRALEAGAAAPDAPLDRVEAACALADACLLAGWVRALPRPERAALGARLRLLAGARPRGARRRAHRETLRAHLFDAARSAGLTCLRGSV
jgi:hypothetical protein